MDVSLVQVQEVSVITVIYKNPTPVISPVLNLVNQTRLNFYLRYITPLIFYTINKVVDQLDKS